MIWKLGLATAVVFIPLAAQAMPEIGDTVGTNPADAKASLERAGCKVQDFEAEDGQIEAKCEDATGKRWEIYINPKSGQVTRIKAKD